jgi:hypothetical protein
VGQNEETVAPVACADFSRRLDARSNAIAQALKVSNDVSQTKGEMAGDVFEEAPLGGDFADDPRNVGPEVAGVGFSFSQSREGERLAGITGSEDMNAAAPWAAVEGFEIVPDRSRIQGRVRHPRHEGGCGETVSLDIAHGAIAGLSDVKAEIEASDAGAKAEAAKVFRFSGGTKSHTSCPFRRALGALVKGSGASDGYTPGISGI